MRPLDRPLILGHRGSSTVAPENTIAAFKRSMADGADGFEFDVRLARDGVPVVIHDANLKRTAGDPRAISDLSSKQLKQIDVGSWFNQRHPDRSNPSYASQTVPLLSEVFELTANTRQLLYVEMKCEQDEAEQLAAAVVQLIANHRNFDEVVVESFDLNAIREVKRLNHHVRTAALFEPRLDRPASLVRKMRTVQEAIDVGANELALHHSLAAPRVVESATASGLPVVVWTVDKPAWVQRAQRTGIHALITNNPALMLRSSTDFSL